MIFGWWTRRRRRALVAKSFPQAWLDVLDRNVAIYHLLPAAQQSRLRDDLRILIAEKTWEGCAGLEMTDDAKIVIAALASVLLLEMDHDYYGSLKTILVYPSAYADPRSERGFDGIARPVVRLGEARYRGPMVLSWPDVLAGARRCGDGHNLVFHEFAHQLDQQDAVFDGTPPLRSRGDYDDWRRVMSTEFGQLVEHSRRGRATLLDHYGATDPAEFFAVATECFFEKSCQLRQRHRQLYDLMRQFYQQDPASWGT